MDLCSAETLARELIDDVNPNVSFRWTARKTAFGDYFYQSQTLRLSKPLTLVRSEAATKNTILHELAHSLAGYQGRGQHHNDVWRDWFVRLGGDPEMKEEADLSGIPGVWRTICLCSKPYYRFKAPRVGATYRCQGCLDTVYWVKQ